MSINQNPHRLATAVLVLKFIAFFQVQYVSKHSSGITQAGDFGRYVSKGIGKYRICMPLIMYV